MKLLGLNRGSAAWNLVFGCSGTGGTGFGDAQRENIASSFFKY